MRLMVPTVTARHHAAVAKCNASIALAKEQGRLRTGNMKYEGPSVATMLWASINNNSTYRQQIGAWLKVAKISHVSIGGGVQVEQLFSYLTFIKDDLRSRLNLPHLNVCMRAYHQAHHYKTLVGFPYMRTFLKWRKKCKRRAAALTVADNA